MNKQNHRHLEEPGVAKLEDELALAVGSGEEGQEDVVGYETLLD